jgi:3-dehydroquinate dehydratase/shikimate dehydrogenase
VPDPLVRYRATPRPAAIGRAREAAISVTVTEEPSADELAQIAGIARHLEVRADLAGDLDPGPLRERFEGSLTYSLRSAERGGRSDASPEERRARLTAASEHYDLVDLEHDRDMRPEILDLIPARRRRISWHGDPVGPGELRARFERMTAVPARLYLLAPRAETAAGGLPPMKLLASLDRRDVTAFATGPAGVWSRLLAPRLGARLTFARLRESEGPGPMTLRRLSSDYGLPVMGRLRDLYGLVGGSVAPSLAPRIYNKGFRALGLPALCVPFAVSDFHRFWSELVEDGLPSLGIAPRGLTVVTPHKESALEVADLSTVGAREAGASNSLVRAGRGWQAATTTRVVDPLEAAGINPAGRRVAIVGCGGAGRSVAAELIRAGAEVTIVNRGARRGDYASELLRLPWVPLADFSPRPFDLIVHATTLSDESPFDVGAIEPGTAVVDLVYRDGSQTALIDAVRARGLTAIDGRRVLASETGGQFELMTGQPMPADAVGIASGEA